MNQQYQEILYQVIFFTMTYLSRIEVFVMGKYKDCKAGLKSTNVFISISLISDTIPTENSDD